MILKHDSKDGISLRTIHLWLIIGAVVISALMLFSTYRLSERFRHLTETSEQQIDLRKAARELMDASDYLTEKVQCFSVQGDKHFLDEYFEEAFEANRREEAIEIMSSGKGTKTALEELQAAMDASVKLMDREYYAMRLVIEAKGYKEYPELLKSVILTDTDKALSASEKMLRAAEMVHDDKYYDQKNVIRNNMKSSLNELEKMAYEEDASALRSLKRDIGLVRLVIILQTLGIFFLVWLASKIGIHPILNAVDRIKEDRPIPVVGANEFRYLARTYNRMYEVYKRSLERLNFKASHDELTGAYNRTGYDLLMSSIDVDSTYMLLFDVDDFKGINDNHGHEIGDKTLVRLVQILRCNFRSDDYICRIGGDEFVVLMVHSAEEQRSQIASKIDRINNELGKTAHGAVPVSVSVGITHGTKAKDAAELFKKTDAALYKAKRSGKHTYSFAD